MTVRDVPTTVVTGSLGVGKTTTVLSLFDHRPEGERWAVLVNEFGEVGIDGAVLGSSGLAVREVAGGCICCSAGVELRAGLVRVLREVQPDRLIIEPTGLARPAAVLDQLRSPGIREAVSVRATIGLVDVRRFLDPAVRDAETYADQVLVSDVLVGHKADLATEEERQAFLAIAGALDPPKLDVALASHGQLDPAWLDLEPAPRQLQATSLHRSGEAVSHGWVLPPEDVFDRTLLELTLQDLVRPNPALPAGVLRLKGIFRTPRAWLWIDATPDTIRSRGTDWRRDSRLEIIAAPEPAPDWDAVEALLRDALRTR